MDCVSCVLGLVYTVLVIWRLVVCLCFRVWGDFGVLFVWFGLINVVCCFLGCCTCLFWCFSVWYLVFVAVVFVGVV